MGFEKKRGRDELGLTRTRRAVLDMLLKADGWPVSAERILREGLGHEQPGRGGELVVRRCIADIRAVLAARGYPRDFVLNEWGRGYRVNVSVLRRRAGGAA